MGATFERWFPGLPATQIAMFHTFFQRSVHGAVFASGKGFCQNFHFIIRDKKNKTKAAVSQTFLDERILNTPAVAMNQTVKGNRPYVRTVHERSYRRIRGVYSQGQGG